MHVYEPGQPSQGRRPILATVGQVAQGNTGSGCTRKYGVPLSAPKYFGGSSNTGSYERFPCSYFLPPKLTGILRLRMIVTRMGTSRSRAAAMRWRPSWKRSSGSGLRSLSFPGSCARRIGPLKAGHRHILYISFSSVLVMTIVSRIRCDRGSALFDRDPRPLELYCRR